MPRISEVDLSSDVGERPGSAGLADDFALLRIVTSANVACGGHAGDRVSMRAICEVAVANGVAIGAQVSYVDPAGFGRRRLDVPHTTLVEQLREQWEDLADAARSAGGQVDYMRPHGALYNAALVDARVADAVLDATPPGTPVLCVAGSALAVLAAERGHPVAAEIFADRAVSDDGLLVPRGTPGAVIEDPDHVAQRLADWLRTGHLVSANGRRVRLVARSICVHSDTPGALHAAAAVRGALLAAGAQLTPFAAPSARPVQESGSSRREPIRIGEGGAATRLFVHQYGERSVLIDVAGPGPAGVAAMARQVFGRDLHDAVPAADCVLLTFASPTSAGAVAAVLSQAPHLATPAGAGLAPSALTPESETTPPVTIDVRYDGPDLADVARQLGTTIEEVVTLHSQATFRVGFFGFSPGFAYLTGLPDRLHLPRRDTPRTAVPAGAVAIAAGYSAVYPRPSPGGWHLLGHTDAVMFDPHRTPPTLLTPGATMRFRPV